MKLQNRNIIIFGEDWGRFPSTTQHIGRQLLKQNKIIWVGSLAHRKPKFSSSDLKRITEKLKNIFGLTKSSKSNSVQISPIIIHPFFIPFHDYRIVRILNNKLLQRKILNAIKENNFSNPILITSSPIVSGLLGKISETSSHYFCLDDYSNFDGAFSCLKQLEKELLEKISSCFCVSDKLYEVKKAKSGYTFYLSQGVENEHFKLNKERIPSDLKELRKPIVGFFGLISEWFDLDLLMYAAKGLPDYTFLIIGKATVDLSILNDFKNIKYIGEVNFNELPNFASCFDIGIIPFKVNDLTNACNPLKLLEYLSLGVPVVSVNLPEINKFGEIIQIANTYEEFVTKIKYSIVEDSEQKRSERRSVAENYSWESITNAISEKILLVENEKSVMKL